MIGHLRCLVHDLGFDREGLARGHLLWHFLFSAVALSLGEVRYVVSVLVRSREARGWMTPKEGTNRLTYATGDAAFDNSVAMPSSGLAFPKSLCLIVGICIRLNCPQLVLSGVRKRHKALLTCQSFSCRIHLQRWGGASHISPDSSRPNTASKFRA